ncbi:MAG: hypothetical protein MOGMAGMI_01197 [Candidatus Omnitrophica bacterium]|nr:hypothetical protein [Candidatus Omnitrophota bacterium]
MSFNVLADQGSVVSALKSALGSGRLAHALLFLGPRGTGRRAAARELAKAVFCPQRTEDLEPCDTCGSCRLVDAGAHPDYQLIEPDEETNNIKIEPVRELIARSGLRPLQAPAKVFVIAEAERMNEYAQNALLKTLEEPPGATHIVLLASAAEGLLPTIRSRAQLVRFRPLGSAPPARAEDLARVQEALGYALSGATAEMALPPDWPRLEREEALAVVDLLARYFRETLLAREGVRYFGGVAERLHGLSRLEQALDASKIESLLLYLGECRELLTSNINLRIFFGVFWGRLRAELTDARRLLTPGAA